MSKVDFTKWKAATSALQAGEQRAFLDVLGLAAEGQITLVHGTDNYGGGACLVNACRQMLATMQNKETTPSAGFSAVVNAFDTVNSWLMEIGVNTGSYFVSELAAQALLQNFGELKPMDIPAVAASTDSDVINAPYREKSDDELAEWLNSRTSTVVPDVVDIDRTDADILTEIVPPTPRQFYIDGKPIIFTEADKEQVREMLRPGNGPKFL